MESLNDSLNLNGRRKKRKYLSFIRKRVYIKMIDNLVLSAAKVVTFNDRGKVSEYYFATI